MARKCFSIIFGKGYFTKEIKKMDVRKGIFYIVCNECRIIHVCDSYDLSMREYSESGGMGQRIIYEYSDEFECSSCHENISYTLYLSEYPIGSIEFIDSECDKGTILSMPQFESKYNLDDYVNDLNVNGLAEAEYLVGQNEKMKHMSSREFELYVADIFKNLGFDVETTKATRDGGYDILISKQDPVPIYCIVECKKYSRRNKVDINVIRNLSAVQEDGKFNKAVVVTTSKFTRDAMRYTDEKNQLITLYEIDDLLIRELKLKMNYLDL